MAGSASNGRRSHPQRIAAGTRASAAVTGRRRGVLKLALVIAALALLALVQASTAGARIVGAGAKPDAEQPPVVTLNPANQVVEEGQPASFTSTASGSPTVQWQISTDGGKNWTAISGANSTTYTIPSTTLSESGHEFRAVFTNGGGSVHSKSAGLGVGKKPEITQQPTDQTVHENATATFKAEASGVPAPSAKWEKSTDGGVTYNEISGAKNPTLKVTNVTKEMDGWKYRVTFTGFGASVTSEAATLHVVEPPVIEVEPQNVTLKEGETATFHTAARGSPSPTVQWEVSTNHGSSWSAISGATADRLTIASAKTSQSGYEYRAAFTNAAGKVMSEAATLTVQKAPAVTKQPSNATIEEGHSAVFEATASGFPAPTVQWEVSTDGGGTWSPIEGATADQLTVADAQTSQTGDEYRAAFANVAGQVTTNAATLTIQDPPKITQEPEGVTVEVGQSAVFEAAASGFPAPTVQWEESTNGGSTWSPVAGATSDQLTIANTTVLESGDEYRAAFSNVAATVKSAAATLTVAVHHYLALDWGQNIFGQLGDGGTEQSDVPIPVSGLSFVTAVAAGNHHSLALLSDGTVMAWGEDESGQLGEGGEPSMSDVPVPVQGLSHVKAIAAGNDFSLALLDNGTVMAWGANEYGQLGTGSTEPEESEVPVAVKGLTGVTAIAAGGEHSLAIVAGGKLMAWGNGAYGEMGDGKQFGSATPVAVQGLTGVQAIAAGGDHCLALLAGGTVKAWGSDEFGQLGNSEVEIGEENERFSTLPLTVNGVSGVTAVAAGGQDSLALLGAGTVMAWGEDKAGELGDGSIVRGEETPVAVSGLSGATAIAAGGEHSMALLANGSVMTWGEDRFGELGNGTAGEPSDVPVAVATLSEVTGIAAGGYHDIAYGEAIPTVTAVSPAAGPTAGGTTVTITGTDFTGATEVKFGGTNATFTFNSPTSITAFSPARAVGTVDVTVTSPSGTSPTMPQDRFAYVAAPTIKKLSPKRGPTSGKTVVTITGKQLSGATAVSFGSTPAIILTNKSATSITAESPAEAAGTVYVTVTTAGGTSGHASHARFKFG
jgi:alpha-tubulin suppressor-like RCC1 family protein